MGPELLAAGILPGEDEKKQSPVLPEEPVDVLEDFGETGVYEVSLLLLSASLTPSGPAWTQLLTVLTASDPPQHPVDKYRSVLSVKPHNSALR
jgi:hypothetical protein